MFEKIKSYLNFRYFLYYFSLIAGYPCVFFLLGWLPHYTVNYLLLLMLATLFVVIKNEYRLPLSISTLMLTQIATWGMYSVIHGVDTSYFTRILMLVITYLFLEMQLSDERAGFIKTYNLWLVFQVVAGSIGFLLVLSGILHPIFEFREMDMRPGYFFGLFTTNTYFDGLVRNAGFYDEPGALAFWGMQALLINKLFIKNKKIELLLIFGLISTLSLAYFIQVAIYIYFFYKKERRRLLPYIIAFMLAIILVSTFSEQINDAVFGRLEYNEDTGTIAGDNRTVLMERCWRIFCDYPILGLGASDLVSQAKSTYGFVGANFFYNWAADGIVGFIITYLPLFYIISLGRYDRKFYVVSLIMFIGFLQRPYDSTQLLYPLMNYTILLHSYLNLKRASEIEQ